MDKASERFTDLYNRFYKDIVLFAKTFTYEIPSAEDIAQKVFMKLHSRLDSVEDKKERAWLYTVCRNDSLKFIKKRSRMVEKAEAEDVYTSSPTHSLKCSHLNPQESLDRKECYEIVDKLLNNLNKKQRDILKLRFFSDLDYDSIAEKLKTSNSCVGFYLSTTLKSLRNELAQALTK